MREWQNYFMLTGTGAVTLIGLLFVVITLSAERGRGSAWLMRTYVTPTLVHFGGVFLISLLALSSSEGDGSTLHFGLIGILGLLYSLIIAVKVAGNSGLFSDAWVFHGGVPVVCYAALGAVATAAWVGVTSTMQVYLVLRVVSAVLLLVGMRNAWAATSDIVSKKV